MSVGTYGAEENVPMGVEEEEEGNVSISIYTEEENVSIGVQNEVCCGLHVESGFGFPCTVCVYMSCDMPVYKCTFWLAFDSRISLFWLELF